MSEVSIIIPVHNGEKYIKRCIESILVQEINDLEIIVIDDKSNDQSFNIIKKLSINNKSIKIYKNKTNLGVAKTRNKGIQLSNSKYLIFIDQDDYLEQGFLRKYIRYIDNGNYDAVYGGYKRINSNNKTLYQIKLKDKYYSRYIIPTGWGKIHRRKFLIDNHIYFSENKIGEDIIFILKEISLSKSIKIVSDNSYVWFYNENSVSKTLQKNLDSTNLTSLLTLLKDMESIDNIDKYFLVRTACFYLINGRNSKAEDYKKSFRAMFDYLKNNQTLKLSRIINPPNGELFKVKISVLMFYIIYKINLIDIFSTIYVKKLLDTKNKDYSDALRKSSKGIKKILNVQIPYKLKLKSLKPGKTLDIGCGTGRNLTNLGPNSVGVDHNQYSIDYIKKQGLKGFTTKDFDKYNNDEFDSLLLAHVIEHMSFNEAEELIKKYSKVLRNNGRIIIVCPQILGFRSGDTHIEFFNIEKITRLLESQGFKILNSSSFPFPEFLGSLFKYNEYWVVARK